MLKSKVMKISEIYEKFNIPPNLQEHMIRVARVANFILDHWKGEQLDRNKIIKVVLLHDLGNVVKFDLDKYPEFLGNEKPRLEYWKKIQKKTIEKYGPDDHTATSKMLKEIGVNEEIIDTISQKSFGNAIETEKSNNRTLKILVYSDFRAGPFGLMPLKERLKEALPRLEKYKYLPHLDKLIQSAEAIEKQIQANLDINVSEITEDRIKTNVEKYLEIEV
jgi:5'-deoxynucleotidase YfbR-like HD superfamily hydrolase